MHRPPRTPEGMRAGAVSLPTDISSAAAAAGVSLDVATALGLSAPADGFVPGLSERASTHVRTGGASAADRSGHPQRVAVGGRGVPAARERAA